MKIIASYLNSTNAVHISMMVMSPIADKYPEKVLPYDKKLMEVMTKLGDSAAPVPGILVSMAKVDEASYI